MKIKNQIKFFKPKYGQKKKLLTQLTYSILKMEQLLIEEKNEHGKIIESIQEVISNCFTICNAYNIDVSNPNHRDLDLDYWKNNISDYRIKNEELNCDIFNYSIRDSLMNLIEYFENQVLRKVHIFEIIIKIFLLLDFYQIDIDATIMFMFR